MYTFLFFSGQVHVRANFLYPKALKCNMSIIKLDKKIKLPKRKYTNYDVITVGSGTVDVFVNTESELIQSKKRRAVKQMIAYPLGSKILVNELRFEVGGGGTNTGVSFAHIGLKTGWIGKIGTCENSRNIIDLLDVEKIDFLGSIGDNFSGYSIILDSIGHDRTILAHKGENNNLSFSELTPGKFKTKWFYFASMMGKSFTTQKRLATLAQRKGIKIAFNPSSYQTKKGITALNPILKRTHILILNYEEACYLVGEMKLKDALKELYKIGPEIVIITNGNKGAFCTDGKQLYTVIPHDVKIKETTGAGDAFASTFVGTYIKTGDIVSALKFASTNAQSIIRHYGAKNILLSWSELKKQEHKMPVTIKINKL